MNLCRLVPVAAIAAFAAAPAQAQVAVGYPQPLGYGYYGPNSVVVGAGAVAFGAGPPSYGYIPPNYGYGIDNGVVGSGYQAAYQFNQQALYATGLPQVMNESQAAASAATSLPGWHGPATGPHRAIHPHPQPAPALSRDKLMRDDGSILWPSATPGDPTRTAAEAAVKVVVDESRTHQHATTRHVVDARNKLKAFAHAAMPGMRAKNPADAQELDRFVGDLQKTLATMAVKF